MNLFTRMRSALFVGFMVLLPLFVTVYLISLVFGIVDRFVGRWFTELLISTGLATEHHGLVWFIGIPFHGRVPVVGILLVVIILLLIGGLARTTVGRYVFTGVERVFTFIPVARGVYSTVQQVSQAFVHENTTFKQVVLIEYPRKGMYAVGFITGDSQGDMLADQDKEFVNIFLPKSPNPTNGWTTIVSRDEVRFLDMPVEEGLRFIISGGVVPPKQKALIETEGHHEKRGLKP
ncbi:DUF502 domain-containing protein [Brevibacillus dissolubilis]|uniref:DUF502 domain-containing protein n=1 Tax=Brevibacillus dissolubilis TaxID=1844116 RepID=UPI0021002422|nr:DUF502 domain-containing protein [Brevibacillus dissolubilis]